MKKFMTPRFGAIVASILLVTALAACGGGGGGGSTTPTPTPTPDTTAPVLTLATSSPASLTATIVVTSNEALSGNVSVTVKNGPQVVTGGTTLNQGNLGMTWTSQGGALTCNTAYTVTASAVDLAGNTGTATFAVTTVGCGESVLRYTDKVYAIWTGGLIYATTKTGVAVVTNSTSHQTAGALLNCSEPNKPLANGRLVFECTALVNGVTSRRNFSLDPTTNILTDYVGTVPSDITFTSAESNSTQPVAGTTAAHVADGWYYADASDRSRLLFQPDAGGAPTIVKAGTFGTTGTIAVIRAYNN